MELKLRMLTGIVPSFLPFNRTLWNWNMDEIVEVPAGKILLIEPYGIETTKYTHNENEHQDF